uniref:Glycine cleavage H-protein, putative n=1 Tax=Theileria annulata TaxID=5874 RepID=A0A3B0MPL7_THEAN
MIPFPRCYNHFNTNLIRKISNIFLSKPYISNSFFTYKTYRINYIIKDNINHGINKRVKYGTSKSVYKELEDDYYLKNTEEKGIYYLGVTNNKFKDFKEIVYITITDEENLNRGDYLFSVEDSKTLFDFYSPINCKVESVNPKFLGELTDEILNDFFKFPENSNNHLIKVKLTSE